MLHCHEGTTARRAGLDLTLSLTSDQAEALGADAAALAEMLDTVLVGIAALRMHEDPEVQVGASMKDRPVSNGRVWDEWLLQDASGLLVRLEGVRNAAVRAHAEHGGSYGQLGVAMGVARGTAQSRRDELGREEPSTAELWAVGGYGPVDHPGVKVPANMRTWSAPWHGYTPVDITPPELRTGGLTASVAEGWAEPYASPDDVPDWSMRHAAALVPYNLDDRRWPLNPNGRTGRTGRNLGKWGENQAADPVVVAGTGPDRRVLLIKRRDRGVWAIPGGMVDPGETAPKTLVRELLEETGIDLAGHRATILARTYVDDWRNTDHAWVSSTVALYELDEQIAATAGDDAADAKWWPFADLDQLTQALEVAEGELYEAHEPLLAAVLNRLNQR